MSIKNTCFPCPQKGELLWCVEPMLTAWHGGYLAFVLTDEVTSYSLTYYKVILWTEDVCRRIPMGNRILDNPVVVAFLM